LFLLTDLYKTQDQPALFFKLELQLVNDDLIFIVLFIITQ